MAPPFHHEDIFQLVREPIDLRALIEHVRAPGDGAIVTFDGFVRNQSHNRATLYLDYEAYESMALVKMREIAAQLHEKYGIHRVAIVHRLGHLEIGETSVFIAVSAPHRAAAFDACRFVLEVLLLPDGHRAFEGVDGKAAGVESSSAVRGADGNEHAGFADFEMAQPMHDGHAMNAIFFVELRSNFTHFDKGHGLIGFVVEVQRGAIVRLIADKAVEGDDSAVSRGADVLNQGTQIDRLANELEDVLVMERRGHAIEPSRRSQAGEKRLRRQGRVPCPTQQIPDCEKPRPKSDTERVPECGRHT